MPRITDPEITLNDLGLHILTSASTPPVDNGAGTDDVGYGGTKTDSSVVTEVTPLAEMGDLTDAWNSETFHDHKQRREAFLQTFKSVQELEITLPLRPSEAAQAAIITAFDARATLIMAIILSDGAATPNEDQLTFSCKVMSHDNMLSAKETRATATFTVNIIGDVAYGARTT